MARNKRVTPGKKPDKRETVTIEKPDRFTDAEWAVLTPLQKMRYATNSSLWKPGETGRVHGTRPKAKGSGKRLETIPLTNPLVVVSGGSGAALPAGGAGDPGGEAPPPMVPMAFEVLESDDPKEVTQVNGTRLLADAYRRAARAPQNLDPFDKHVYLALLQKMPGLKLEDDRGPETAAESKRNVRLLQDLLSDEAQFREVPGGGK